MFQLSSYDLCESFLLPGLPATEKKTTMIGVIIHRFANGKVVEAWWSRDLFSLVQQLGIIPTLTKPENGQKKTLKTCSLSHKEQRWLVDHLTCAALCRLSDLKKQTGK